MQIDALVTRAKQAVDETAAAGGSASAQRQQLQKAAAEFEAMLLNQVLKDMRRSGKWGDEEEDGGDSLGAESLFEMIDGELASALTKSPNGSFGLGKQMLEQLDRMNLGAATADVAKAIQAEQATSLDSARGKSLDPARDRRETAQVSDRADGRAKETAALADVGVSDAAATRAVGTATRAVSAAGRAAEPQPAGTTGFVRGVRATDIEPVSNIDESPAVEASAAVANPSAPKVTSAFGWRRDPMTGAAKFHKGVDLKAAYGQEVQAAGSGRVVFSGSQGGYGTTVMIEHADGSKTRYAHLSVALVSAGDTVSAGQALGRVGSTGRSTGPHLHFEVLDRNGRAVNPMNHRVS